MPQAWPLDVNLGVVRTTYREQTISFVDRQDGVQGPPLENAASSIVMRVLSFEGRYTAAEKTSLDTFWEVALLKGTQPFTRAHPITGVDTLFKFDQAPETVGAGATNFHVALVIRTMP